MKRWPTRHLGELCDVRIGRTPPRDEPRFWGGDAVWVTIRDLNGGEIRSSRETVSDVAVRECMPEPVPTGTLLFSFKLSIGKMAVAGCPLYTNEAIAALPIRKPAELSRDFLRYALLRESHEGAANTAVMGKVLNKEKVQQLLIPMPSLAEQERIMKLLDEADELRKLRVRADRRAADLIPALFHEMFGNDSDKKSWPDVQLGEMVRFVGGGTPSRARPEFFKGTIPWATSKDVKAEYLSDTEEHVTNEGIENSATTLVPAGSVLVVVKSKILMHSLPVAIATVPICFGQDLKGLICGSETISEFVACSLRMRKAAILAQARGANTEGLTLDILRSVRMSLPPLPLQKEFARRVTEIREMEAKQAASRRRSDDLFQSLLHRAFNGEL